MMTSLPTHHLGDLSVSGLALGCMSMSGMYGSADRGEGIATIHAALDAGVTMLDTGDFYGSGDNELLIAEALRDRNRDDVTLSVKFGALRDPVGGFAGNDARPEAIGNFLAYTMRRLSTDHVDVYRPARLDPAVPIEETIGAIADHVDRGHVRHVGLSEVGPDTIRRAHATHPITDLQVEWSLLSRDVEHELLGVCRELGIGITAYSTLSRGLLSGHFSVDRQLEAGDFRAHSPRFQGDNLATNLRLVDRLSAVADDLGATTAQVAIAWVLNQGDDVVALLGPHSPQRLADCLAAADLDLDDDALAAIEAAVPASHVAGDRYPVGMTPDLTTT